MAKKKKRDKHRRRLHTPIQQHKIVGKTLIPPLNSVPGTSFSSWRDDHAPEMLWAFLLASTMPRDTYLGCFRMVLNWAHEKLQKEKPETQQAALPPDGPFGLACELDQTGLSKLGPDQFDQFAEIVLRHPLSYGALRPLLLIDCLPARDRWAKAIGVDPTEHDWDTFSSAVAHTLDHQSEISTDIRWLKIMSALALDRLRVRKEMALEFMEYPNVPNITAVRPSIRACEITMRRNPPSPWIEQYWSELLTKTSCVDGSKEAEYFKTDRPPIALSEILKARSQVVSQFHAIKTSTRTDARFDAAFGFALNALAVLEEVSAPPISQLVLGRLGLRALTEILVTFSYLLKVDDAKEWVAYRSYGSGQAKLAFLKLEEATGDAPRFVDRSTLEELANEDRWQEFQNIDLGHWANTNLRDLAIKGGTKDIYDRYYNWTSAYTHSQWCAVRDANFITCHNFLHRLHRIPRPHHRLLPNVVDDAIALVNRVFELLQEAFPEIEELPRFVESRPTPTSTPMGESSKAGAPREHQEH